MTQTRRDTETYTTDPGESRRRAMRSYKRLLNKMFGNLVNDINVGIQASNALSATGKIYDQSDDEADGKFVAEMLETLLMATKRIDDLYRERFGNPVVTKEEWARLDAIDGGSEE